ncbi:zinc knuckle CX2CX4HX4C containing protein [Tanacetum coccineum]
MEEGVGEGDINSFLNKFTNTIKNMEKKISGSTRQVTFESVPLSETTQVNSDVGNGSIDKRIKPVSYASLLNSGKTSKKDNFRSLDNTEKVEGADLVIPMANVQQDGLSMIATKLGRPIMLDAYTSTMCIESWGRTSYARALVEITSDQELKESIVVAIPRLNGKGHTMEKIRVKFEWKPPRCDVCKIFGHVNEQCSINIKSTRINDEDQECFIIVGRKRGKGNMHNRPSSRQIDGARLNKPKLNFQYRPVNKTKKNENKPFSLEKVNLVEL